MAASAINIRNLFKFNFDFICFLSGAAVVFTFIRFASFWFCSFASENSKHPAKLLTSLLADLSGLVSLAGWLASWLTDCPLTTIIVIIGPGSVAARNLKTHKLKTKVKMF